jgi:hypothetical protein
MAEGVALEREIARYSLKGHSPGEIAALTTAPVDTVLQVMMSGSFATALTRARREDNVPDTTVVLKAGAAMAARTAMKIMLMGTEKAQLTAAFKWLDRSGHAPQLKADVNFRGILATGHLSEDDLRDILLNRVRAIKDSAPPPTVFEGEGDAKP